MTSVSSSSRALPSGSCHGACGRHCHTLHKFKVHSNVLHSNTAGSLEKGHIMASKGTQRRQI